LFGKGKYRVDILRRFRMEDYKPMATPIITNLKKVVTLDSELVDPRIDRKIIRSLMYFVNNKPDFL
jgi:hypothetical protein